jgi:hypothetical protein
VDFDPKAAEEEAGVQVRRIFVERVQIAVDADLIAGDPTDIALVFFALLDGLAAAENARRLGSSEASAHRRWNLGVKALLAGLRP